MALSVRFARNPLPAKIRVNSHIGYKIGMLQIAADEDERQVANNSVIFLPTRNHEKAGRMIQALSCPGCNWHNPWEHCGYAARNRVLLHPGKGQNKSRSGLQFAVDPSAIALVECVSQWDCIPIIL